MKRGQEEEEGEGEEDWTNAILRLWEPPSHVGCLVAVIDGLPLMPGLVYCTSVATFSFSDPIRAIDFTLYIYIYRGRAREREKKKKVGWLVGRPAFVVPYYLSQQPGPGRLGWSRNREYYRPI